MSVREIKRQSDPLAAWSEVCARDHGAPAATRARIGSGTALAPRPVNRPLTRPVSRPGDRMARRGRTANGQTLAGRPVDTRSVVARSVVAGSMATRSASTSPAPTRSVAPGRRLSERSVSGHQARACRVEAPLVSPVVDDVPTWALLTCGIVVGIIMLLALAFLGGPAYA